MLKIGLTGGIGSGKSTAAKYFAKLGAPIIDADKIAYQLLKPNTKTYKKAVTHFGKDFLTLNKLLNRKKLSKLIFTNNKERKWLEKLLHPAIQKEINRFITKIKKPYCIIMAPLLLETKFPIKIDRILVIDCSKKDQIKRTHNRDHRDIKEIQTIIKTQLNRKLRLQKADDVIRNNGTLNNLRKAVAKTHRYYLTLI